MAVQRGLTPEGAVERLEREYAAACRAMRDALAHYAAAGAVPTADERTGFRYPELRVDWQPSEPVPFTRRAWAKFQAPGLYAISVTQPDFFRGYLLEQLRPLVDEFGAHIDVGVSDQEIPYPFVTEAGDEFVHADGVHHRAREDMAADLGRLFHHGDGDIGMLLLQPDSGGETSGTGTDDDDVGREGFAITGFGQEQFPVGGQGRAVT